MFIGRFPYFNDLKKIVTNRHIKNFFYLSITEHDHFQFLVISTSFFKNFLFIVRRGKNLKSGNFYFKLSAGEDTFDEHLSTWNTRCQLNPYKMGKTGKFKGKFWNLRAGITAKKVLCTDQTGVIETVKNIFTNFIYSNEIYYYISP